MYVMYVMYVCDVYYVLYVMDVMDVMHVKHVMHVMHVCMYAGTYVRRYVYSDRSTCAKSNNHKIGIKNIKQCRCLQSACCHILQYYILYIITYITLTSFVELIWTSFLRCTANTTKAHWYCTPEAAINLCPIVA